MGFLSSLLDNLYNSNKDQYNSSNNSLDKGNSNIMSFSVGFNNPGLNFKAHGLTNNNFSNIQSKISRVQNFKTDEIKTANYNTFRSVRKSLMQVNPLEQRNYRPFFNIYNNSNIENVFKPNAEILTNFNNYRFRYNSDVVSLAGYKKDDKENIIKMYNTSKAAPSLFNPLFMVLSKGITPNTPLLTTESDKSRYDTSDCSIRELIRQSYSGESILGLARYRYVDFMYCRDLGKIPNNRLITLRKFAYPIGDNIFEHYDDGAADIGRLVTWFGNEENKLEDILNYSYKATWKQLSAKIDEIPSQEDQEGRGPIGMLINTLSPSYNAMVGKGYTSGKQSIFSFLGGGGPTPDSADAILRNYDNNKVYTPKNTIQDTVTYEGKLEFTHEFTLVFTYKLRAYDNINPRSAFLDLLGNVMNVTYRRGKFWGGDRRFIGPPQNTTGWSKANAMIDGAWEKAGNALMGLSTGTLKLGDIFGAISGLASKLMNDAKNMVQNLTGGESGGNSSNTSKAQKVVTAAVDWAKKQGLDKAALGMLKNKLGRPALYAMDSLLTGDNVGLWHVTIGNPKNPIAAMGNLILENASVQHYGPLGIDDFPTELKVTVTLKHARSRDAVEIGRMYTKGTNGIYLVTHGKKIDQFYPAYSGGSITKTTNKTQSVTIDNNGNISSNTDNNLNIPQTANIINNSQNSLETIETPKLDARELELKNLYDTNYIGQVSNDININSGMAGKMDHYNQLLSYDLAILLDEIA